MIASRATRRAVGFAGVFLASLTAGACPKVPVQSASMQAAPNIIASSTQLQLMTFEMGRNFSTIVERAADSIAKTSSDPQVRLNALLWKVSAIPLIQEAALRSDPLVAAVDLWAFALQQQAFLTTGTGSTEFGVQQPIAVAAAREMEQDIRDLENRATKTGAVLPRSVERVRSWVDAHPMQGPLLSRASILDSDWNALGLSDNSIAAALGNVDRSVANLTYRLSYLNETLAAEIRWNAALAAQQALSSPPFDSLMTGSTSPLRTVGILAADAPALIARERAALLADVERQRVLAFKDIDRQRVAVFADLAVQRVALEAAITAQRDALMGQVRQERIATLIAVDTLAQQQILHSGAMLRRLAWELLFAALVVVGAMLGSALYVVRHWRATEPR